MKNGLSEKFRISMHCRGMKSLSNKNGMTINSISWLSLIFGELGSMEYLFFAITLKFTQNQISNPCMEPLYGSNI